MFNFLINLKLTFKLLIPATILLGISITIFLLAQNGFKRIDGEVDEVVKVTSPRLVAVLELSNSLNEATITEKNTLVVTDTDELRTYRDNYNKYKTATLEAADQIIALADTPERKTSNEGMKKQVLEYFAAADKTIQLCLNGQREEAVQFSTTTGRKERREVTEMVSERVAKNKKEMQESVMQMDAINDEVVRNLLIISTSGILFGLLSLFVILRYLVLRPISSIISAMENVSQGRLETEVLGTQRKDEVGSLAKALQVFKDNAIETIRLTKEQELMKQRSAEEQKAALNKMADTFEQNVGGIVNAVASSAAQMQGAAKSLSATAEETSSQAAAVSAATTETSTNVQTVASATEELTASIGEISQQVQRAASATNTAVEAVQQTTLAVEELSNVANNIGQVIELIRGVADQTNLLALNATIEAARAGDAGKGFAVVAGEVKALAGETARATNEIAERIVSIQQATRTAIGAIQNIEGAINNVNEITGTIASAVVEQQTATQEIAGNVQEASTGVNEVSSNILGVTEASGSVGAAATQMLTSADELTSQAQTLKTEVATFLNTVRAA